MRTTATANATRVGFRWNINECLTLQREYELLELTVQEIAIRHKRSVNAILCKLEQEGFISNWTEARGYSSSANQNVDNILVNECFSNEDDEDDEDDEDEEQELGNDDSSDYVYNEEESDDDDESFDEEEQDKIEELTSRVWSLETSVNDIKNMVKQLFDSFVFNKQTISMQSKETSVNI
jgi:hypothetical protein